MSSVTLIHPEVIRTVPVFQAITKCTLFQNNLTLTSTPYRIQSSVSLSIFQDFISALEGTLVSITSTNFTGLHRLSEEFGFDELSAKLSTFCQIESPLLRVQKAQLSESFEFVVNGTVIEIDLSEAAALSPAVQEQLSVDGCARAFFVDDSGIETADIHSLQLLLSGETISIRKSQGLLSSFLGNVSLERLFLGCSKADIRMNLSNLVIEERFDLESIDVSVEALDSLLLNEFVTVESEDSLLQFILKLDRSYRGLLRHIQIEFLSEDGLSLLDEIPESIWNCAAERIAHPPFPLNSRIISGFPEIFAEFRTKSFKILWRDSRDGFGSKEFHRRCDGHANTLTVILDTKGNIFGSFTPVKWESQIWKGDYGNLNNTLKEDDSLKSFLFTLTNPHNIPARRFALKARIKDMAITCYSGCGPHFGGIGVSDNCNTNTNNVTWLGPVYINDTGLGMWIVFTGSWNFQVAEIEVFEIRA
jgi:hypothetical protein